MIFNLLFDNKVDYYYLNNISFKINNYKTDYLLSTFTLKIWWKEIAKSIVWDDWIINFKWNFQLYKSNIDQKIELIKDSIYLYNWSYNINYLNNSIKITDKNWNQFENIIWWNFTENLITINDDSIVKCIDVLSTNLNCNNYLSWNFGNSNSWKQDTLNNSNNNTSTTNTPENNNTQQKQSIYEKIDSI